MSIDQSVEKEAISDYSDIFQGDIDDIKIQLTELSEGFRDLHLFYLRPTKEEKKEEAEENAKIKARNKDKENDYYDIDFLFQDERVWQYKMENQTDFILNKFKISSKLDMVYPVVRDINEIFTISPEQLKSQGEASTQPQAQNVVNVVQPQQQQMVQKQGFLDKLRRVEKGTIPKSLEDAWNRTQEWQITTMNIPNLWAKFLDWHEKGILRQDIFEEGMEYYLKIERWYLHAILEPNITKMVQRGLMLAKDRKLIHLKDVYSGTLQLKQAQDQMALFAQQMGGGGQSNQ